MARVSLGPLRVSTSPRFGAGALPVRPALVPYGVTRFRQPSTGTASRLAAQISPRAVTVATRLGSLAPRTAAPTRAPLLTTSGPRPRTVSGGSMARTRTATSVTAGAHPGPITASVAQRGGK